MKRNFHNCIWRMREADVVSSVLRYWYNLLASQIRSHEQLDGMWIFHTTPSSYSTRDETTPGTSSVVDIVEILFVFGFSSRNYFSWLAESSGTGRELRYYHRRWWTRRQRHGTCLGYEAVHGPRIEWWLKILFSFLSGVEESEDSSSRISIEVAAYLCQSTVQQSCLCSQCSVDRSISKYSIRRRRKRALSFLHLELGAWDLMKSIRAQKIARMQVTEFDILLLVCRRPMCCWIGLGCLFGCVDQLRSSQSIWWGVSCLHRGERCHSIVSTRTSRTTATRTEIECQSETIPIRGEFNSYRTTEWTRAVANETASKEMNVRQRCRSIRCSDVDRGGWVSIEYSRHGWDHHHAMELRSDGNRCNTSTSRQCQIELCQCLRMGSVVLDAG